ncbi:MAG: zinc-ribbon domain-containing protein [Pseudomonadota bacterium]
MRLTCPNCGAQYEIDATVIPEEGRDVQCSSCGHTWFQLHPELALEPEEPPVEEALPRRQHDPEVMGILREEAERERAARAAERAPLESQPELEMPAPPPPRSAGAMPSLPPRGRAADPLPDDDVAPVLGDGDPGDAGPGGEDDLHEVAAISDDDRARRTAPRRALLPDIEEINSAIAGDPEHGDDPMPVATANRRAREARSRRMGFGIAVGIFAGFTMLYSQGMRIAAAVPAFAPALEAYVGAIDSGRIWLDGALRAAVSPDEDESGASEG